MRKLDWFMFVSIMVVSAWTAHHWWNYTMVTLHVALGGMAWAFIRYAREVVRVVKLLIGYYEDYEEFQEWRKVHGRAKVASAAGG